MEPVSQIRDQRSATEPAILWDIMEEYVDEAEFAVERFELGLDDFDYNLAELAEGPEAKILACVDGLLIGGPPVVDRLLRGEIDRADSEEPARVTAVGLALLASDRRDLVAPYLSHASESVRGGAIRACALTSGPKIDPWLLDQLSNAAAGSERATVLDAIAGRGLRLDSLIDSLKGDDTAEVAAAARAAKRADAKTHLGTIQWLALHGEPAVRDAALLTALHYGSLECWNLCERLALDPAEPHPMAMEMYAALGGPPQHDRLAETLALDSHRAFALRALGFSGNLGMIERLLPYLQEGGDTLDARLTTEAISLIAGLDLRDDAFIVDEAADEGADEEELPPLDQDLKTDLSLQPEDALPMPNLEAIRDWWEVRGPQLDPKQRHLAGQPWSPAAIAHYLEHGTARSRHTIASSLSIRTGGAVLVDTRAFAERQHAQMKGIASLGRTHFVRSYSQW